MAASRRRKRPHAHPPADFDVSEQELRQHLIDGTERATLETYLGAGQYRELQALALEAIRNRISGGPRVYVLPGIMQSKLGRRRRGALPDDVLWVDPIEIAAGRLLELALPGGNRFHALGVMLISYLKLKLKLEIAGFDVEFHPFDWRQSIDLLGRGLMARVRGDPAPSVSLVAHSMGGLVSRAAIALDRKRKIDRLIMLGTPNFGSFAPVLAFRATYPAVRRIATLDRKHSPEMLARHVFTTFPGLHQMLPAPERFDAFDLCDLNTWPRDGLSPSPRLSMDVARVRAKLAGADQRFSLIAGVNQNTVVGLKRLKNAFEYQLLPHGDGTVPVELALLPDTPTWYVDEDHTGLPNNDVVAAAVVELLRKGTVTGLYREWHRSTVPAEVVTEAQLRSLNTQKNDWTSMTPEEHRALLEGLVLPLPRRSG